MSLAALEKRLEAVEAHLTPQEWAIRLADEMRKHPSEAEFFKAEAQRTLAESAVMRPFHALAEHAEARHPGKRPEDWQAKRELYRRLHDEYDGLKVMLLEVNQNTRGEGRVLGYRALLNLASVPDPPFAERDVTIAIELMKAWREQAVSTLEDLIAHQAAVQIVRDRYFNGHAILFKDVEELLTTTVGIMQTAVEEYGACREITAAAAAQRKGRRKGDAPSGEVMSALDIEAVRAGIDASKAAALAERWVSTAKRTATIAGLADDRARAAYSWRWLREECGVES